MPSKATKARMGAKGAVAMARHPTLRWVATSPAKLGWHVGKVVVRRKGHAQIERLGVAGRTVGSFAVIYGPMVAEVFGLVEAPKPRRRAQAFVAGVVIGAGAGYVLGANNRDRARGDRA
jgi:hypothetical protein